MKAKIIQIILILTVLLSGYSIMPPQTVAAQGQIDGPEFEAFFDEFLTSALAEHHIPGAAIVVVQGSEIVFAKGYGYANLENNTPVDPETTIFRWASVSKLFPIVGVLQLVDQEMMDLDADINQYLRNWQVPNDFSTPVQVRDLLQHTDGFAPKDLAAHSLDVDSLQPLGSLLSKEMKSPLYEPGSQIIYGGFGTALAGHLLEQVTGNSFEDHIAKSFFEPLEMRHSTFHQVLPQEFEENLAPIYIYVDDTDSFIPAPFLYMTTSPSGGLSATPLDMAHFVIALLNDGRYEDVQILSPTSTQAMLETQIAPYPDFPGVTFGFLEHFSNYQRGLIRDGSGLRTRAQVYLLPEHHLGYIYVQNTSGDEVIDELNEVFLDTFYPAPDITVATISPGDNSQLAGNYRSVQTDEYTFMKSGSLLYGELRVEANPDNSLTITPPVFGDIYGGFEGSNRWAEIAPQVFQRTDRERYIAFRQDENTRKTYLLSGSGYHGAYYKLNWYEASTVQFIWLGLCISVMLSALVIWPFGLLIGRKEKSVLANLARWVGSLTSLLLLIGHFGGLYTGFIRQIADTPAVAFGVSPILAAMLGVTLCGAILGLTTPVFSFLAWKDRYWSVWGRIHYSVLAVSTLAFVWWLNYWNLLGFRY